MKLAIRRVVLTSGAVISFLFFLLFLVNVLGVVFSRTKGVEWKAEAPVWPLVAIGLSSGFSLFGGFGFRRLFRRVSSLEIYFFLLFIVSLSFDAIKVLNWVFLIQNLTPYLGGLITRVVFFGYFFGLFCLFTSSLYSGEISYQKIGTLLGMIGTICLALSYSMPVDITSLQPTLLYRVGGEEYLFLLRIGLMVLTLLSFARSALISRSREEWSICGAVALLLVGRELIFYKADSPLSLVGFVMLAIGSFYFSRKSYLKHLWI